MSVTCQLCGKADDMSRVLNLGYMPPPNSMATTYDPQPQEWLPTEVWWCSACELAQLGYVPDQTVTFPQDYPYTSGATPALRRNFEDLASKCYRGLGLKHDDLVMDIGSNDGTLLRCFDKQQKVLGIEPTDAAQIAVSLGTPTRQTFFGKDTIVEGYAKIITCTNCFAHMPNIHDVVENIKAQLADDGTFISESHYLLDLIDTLQYDTIYAEHLRYYTVASILKLLNAHGMHVAKVERIPTHGGSIRVFAKKGLAQFKKGAVWVEPSSYEIEDRLAKFAVRVQHTRLVMQSHLNALVRRGARVVGIGAPSRGSTVINYLRLDSSIIEYVAEQPQSHKIGRYMPGTDIPVVDEKCLYENPPDAAILFSWHLADELIPKIRAKGFHGEIILPCSATIVNESPAEVA